MNTLNIVAFADPGDCPDCGRPAEFCGCEEPPDELAWDAHLAAQEQAFREQEEGEETALWLNDPDTPDHHIAAYYAGES